MPKRRHRAPISTARAELGISVSEWIGKIQRTESNEQLDCISRDIRAAEKSLGVSDYARIIAAGLRRRRELQAIT